MLHLFNKTYITLDNAIDLDYHRFVISRESGFPLADILSTLHPGKLLGCGVSMEHMILQEMPLEYMLEQCLLKNNEGYKCILYCDKDTFCLILSLWFKSIFANIDCESSYKIIQAYFQKRSLLSFITDRGHKDDYQFVITKKPTLDEFSNIFNNTLINDNITQFTQTLTDSKTLEYLLASYIYDGSYKEELKLAVKKLISRHVEEDLKETWRTIAENALLKPQFLTNIGITTNYTIDNLQDLMDEEYLQPLIKTNAWRLLNSKFNPNRKELNLKEFDWREILRIKNQIQAANWEPVTHKPLPEGVSSAISRTFLYIDCLCAEEFTDEHLEKILTFEQNNFDHTRFWGMKDNENINCYLADYFLSARYSNQNSSLEPFKLR